MHAVYTRLYLLLLLLSLTQLALAQDCFDLDLSTGRPVTVISDNSSSPPQNLNDGNLNSGWTTAGTALPDTLEIQLGIPHYVCVFAATFGSNYAKSFSLYTSIDGQNWDLILTETNNEFREVLYESLTGLGSRLRIIIQSAVQPNNPLSIYEVTALGYLDAPYQVLSFPPIADRLVSGESITLGASASSGLPISYQVLEGPAQINGNQLQLTGQGGTVRVQASQPGNATYQPAESVVRTFQAINPADVYPTITIGNPSPEFDVSMAELGPITLHARANIPYPQWFSISEATFVVDGQTLSPRRGQDGYFYLDWTPTSYGAHSMEVTTTASNGNTQQTQVDFNIVPEAENHNITTFLYDDIIAFVNSVHVESFHLPSNLGSYSRITGLLDITCPSIGCDGWDRLAHIEVRNPKGEWVEIIRYITPYGIGCSHQIDLTPYRSILQGYVEMRVRIETYQRGWSISLSLDYEAGQPAYRYSRVEKLWHGILPFGNPQARQPADTIRLALDAPVQAAQIHLVTTGHGWGPNNTGNAAEFFETSHQLRINNQNAFTQHPWTTCDPNPDGCQPQFGTWYFPRAGWCPGAISPGDLYNLNSFLNQGPLELTYQLDPNYTDFCHPATFGCVTDITCPNCNDGFNPILAVAGNLITYSNSPLTESIINASTHVTPQEAEQVLVFPNPARQFINLICTQGMENPQLSLFDASGRLMWQQQKSQWLLGDRLSIEAHQWPTGIYYLHIKHTQGTLSKIISVQ